MSATTLPPFAAVVRGQGELPVITLHLPGRVAWCLTKPEAERAVELLQGALVQVADR